MVRILLVMGSAAGGAVGVAVAGAVPRVTQMNGATTYAFAADDAAYVALQLGSVTRIFDARGRIVRTIPKGCVVADLFRGDALISCDGGGPSKVVDLARRTTSYLPDGVTAFGLGRYWVLGERPVPVDPTAVRPADRQWVWVGRHTHAVVPAGPPFSDVGAPSDPPLRERLDSPARTLPVDPAWIPVDAILIARRGPQALGFLRPAGVGVMPLDLYRKGHPTRRLSACAAGCARPRLGGGLTTWSEPVRARPRSATVRYFDGHRVRSLGARILRNAVILDVAHTRGRIFVVFRAGTSTSLPTLLRSYPVH